MPPPVSGLTPNFTGSNLRKRVSATYYREQEGGAVSQASFYGYDIAGNVKNLWQHVQGIGFKSLQYEYDLASGKVNFISYQDGANDRFYYQYKYDRDIRLIQALTGTEADILPQGSELLNEKTNVTYQYYLHGPLARMELGHDKVQGVDYAYTLQGWLKGINGHKLNAAQEMGNDGVANTDRATIARDVMAYTLGYYQGDYQPIGAGSATAFPMQFTTQPADITGHDLYNGNISHTTIALSKFRSGDPVGYSYRYDQLNRLKQMRRHGLAANTTTWNSGSISDKFKESIVYDGNGNIKTYLRNGANETGMPLAMDNLAYVYSTAIDPVSGNPYLVNNRLTQVTDQVANGNYAEDIDGQSANNYHYDKIGNLVKDVKENIDRIEWTVYGKIKKITKGNGDIIAYTYDAAGNRASKSVTQSGVTTITWYVRDAQGNSLALYSDKQGGQSGMWWKEQSLYGSSRLGIWAPEINISSTNGTSEWSVAGKTVYELSNHLGNVMATITDKKIGHDPGNGIIDYYNADVTSATDYYPFGMQMPGRNWSSSTYRYGFNGKENDNEVKGTGNQQDYGMRIYDPRIAKFLSEDPLTKDYPWYTPYQFAGNTPIQAIDLDGEEPEYSMGSENERLKRQGEIMLKQLDSRNNTLYRYQSPQSTLSSAKPAKNEYEKTRQEVVNKREFSKVGRNPDGVPTLATQLANNKTFKNFSENLALPLLEGYSMLSGLGELKAAYKGLIYATGKKEAAGVAIEGMGTKGETAYRAIHPDFAESTVSNGFYRSGAAGRLGNDGIYANNTVKGATAEFQYHNPGITPAVFEVKYPLSAPLQISPPSGYFAQPLPFTQGANILVAPSVRAAGTTNLLIRQGARVGSRIQ